MQEMGFWFNYKNNHLSSSKVINSVELRRYDKAKADCEEGVPLFVRCDKCNQFMDFTSGDGEALNGSWKCPLCGTTVKQRTVYMQLDRENRKDPDFNN